MRYRFTSTLGALWLLAATAVAGESARQILDRQRALDRGERRWADRHQQLAMEVIDPARAPRRLTLDLFDKKYPSDEQRTMAYFSAPDSVKGTAFLAVTRPDRTADQWLFLPEIQRARRIGGAVRKQGFVGTDFTYHDLDLLAAMPSWDEEDASSSLEGEAVVDGTPCHVIALTPRREEIGYQRIVLWLGKDDLIARQVEFYEEAPTRGWFGGSGTPPTRRLKQSDVRRAGAIPVAYHAEVETPSAGTKTVVTFSEIAFDRGLPDDLFTQPAMERGRYTP
ncbi:MAG: outer membrane lipoprotein-sorting protein [bacterium]